VRGDRLDARTDIYSLAATLYYLLAGKAPFEGGDAASTLARIVADPAPPLRNLRPEISKALERVVLRGLERQRERRWQTMEEFRDALLPFVPGNLSKGGMGIRFGAFLLDYLVTVPLSWITVAVLIWSQLMIIRFDAMQEQQSVWVQVLSSLPQALYYAVLEGWFGFSVGKWLLNLRVYRTNSGEPPGLGRGLVRACVFFLILGIPVHLSQQIVTPQAIMRNPLLALLTPLSSLIGVGLVLCTMRARNGYRGVHEFLSGTRVVMLPWRKRRKKYRAAVQRSLLRPEGMPGRVGPYAILGALRWSDSEKILVGEDKALARKVWVQLRPPDDPGLSHVRRDVARTTRLRWLASGADAGVHWDAFLAPRGCLLTDAVAAGGRITWTEARPLLEDLTDELLAAHDDGTLPEHLAIEQIWMQPNGHLQLLDVAIADADPGSVDRLEAPGPDVESPDDDQRSLTLLTKAAVLALEPPTTKRQPGKDRIRAPMPLHAARFLNRLVGTPRPYKSLTDFHDDLVASREQSTEVSRVRRLGHVLALTLFLLAGVGCCLFPIIFSPSVRHVVSLDQQIRSAEKTLSALDQNTPLELASQLVQPDGWSRLRGVAQWQSDVALRGRLQQRLVEYRGEHKLWQDTLHWPGRQLAGFVTLPAQTSQALRRDAERILATEGRSNVGNQEMVAVSLIIICIWPVLAAVWAFLWRGGLTYLMTGIVVVRRDGRKAARWQCAWRAFLFWAPLFALQAATILFDYWFWKIGDPQVQGFPAWLPLLASLAFCAPPLVLVGYIVLALWSPTRSWHDRLAGTLLMPR
jgi:uncharacterized RDD family membrane protein YckC